MNQRQKLIKGLQILDKYDVSGFGVCAEHDIIYGIHPEKEISQEDRRELIALSWHISPETGNFAFGL